MKATWSMTRCLRVQQPVCMMSRWWEPDQETLPPSRPAASPHSDWNFPAISPDPSWVTRCPEHLHGFDTCVSCLSLSYCPSAWRRPDTGLTGTESLLSHLCQVCDVVLAHVSRSEAPWVFPPGHWWNDAMCGRTRGRNIANTGVNARKRGWAVKEEYSGHFYLFLETKIYIYYIVIYLLYYYMFMFLFIIETIKWTLIIYTSFTTWDSNSCWYYNSNVLIIFFNATSPFVCFHIWTNKTVCLFCGSSSSSQSGDRVKKGGRNSGFNRDGCSQRSRSLNSLEVSGKCAFGSL